MVLFLEKKEEYKYFLAHRQPTQLVYLKTVCALEGVGYLPPFPAIHQRTPTAGSQSILLYSRKSAAHAVMLSLLSLFCSLTFGLLYSLEDACKL